MNNLINHIAKIAWMVHKNNKDRALCHICQSPLQLGAGEDRVELGELEVNKNQIKDVKAYKIKLHCSNCNKIVEVLYE